MSLDSQAKLSSGQSNSTLKGVGLGGFLRCILRNYRAEKFGKWDYGLKNNPLKVIDCHYKTKYEKTI